MGNSWNNSMRRSRRRKKLKRNYENSESTLVQKTIFQRRNHLFLLKIFRIHKSVSKIHKILFFIDFCDVKPWGLLALIVIIRKNNSFFSCFYKVLIYVDVEMLRTLQNIFDLSIDSLIYLFLFCFTHDICFPYDCYLSVFSLISHIQAIYNMLWISVDSYFCWLCTRWLLLRWKLLRLHCASVD